MVQVAEEVELPKDAEPKPAKRVRNRSRSGGGRKPSLEAPLRSMLETVGGVWHMSEATRGGHVELTPDLPTCGAVLVAQAPDIARALNLQAQADPNVYRWLDRMMTGGGWGSVVLATWPVAQAVLSAHVMAALERRRAEAQMAAEGEAEWPERPAPTTEL